MKFSALTRLFTPDALDELAIVDKSDLSQATTGSTRKTTVADLNSVWATGVAASNASAASKAAAAYVCDGTDDQIEINAALAALSSYGGSVVLSEGTFNCSAFVDVITDNTALVGQGGSASTGEFNVIATKPGGTTLKFATGLTGQLLRTQRPSNDYPLIAVTLRDFLIDGNAKSGSAVNGIFWQCAESFVQNVHVANMSGDGIVIGGYNILDSHDNYFMNVRSRQNAGRGWYLTTYSTDNNFFDCMTKQNGGDGMTIETAGQLISGCHLYNNEGRTITLTGSTLRITGSRISNGALGGIYGTGISSATDVQIMACYFDGNSEASTGTYDEIHLEPTNTSHSPLIIGNTFADIGATPGQARYSIYLGSNTRDGIVGPNLYRTGAAATAFINNNHASNLILDTQGMVRVDHGATAGTTRPTMQGAAYWVGSATPSNALDGDIWLDTT